RLPGHGGHSPLEGLGAEPIAPIALTSILTAALATLGLGLVLGPEAPLIALGLGMGALAVKLVRSEGTPAQLLAFSGAFAAIAAASGGPEARAFPPLGGEGGEGEDPAPADGGGPLAGLRARGAGGARLPRRGGLERPARAEPRPALAPAVRERAHCRPGVVPA